MKTHLAIPSMSEQIAKLAAAMTSARAHMETARKAKTRACHEAASRRRDAICDWIAEVGKATVAQIAHQFGIQYSTANQHMHYLCEEGRTKMQNHGNARVFVVVTQ